MNGASLPVTLPVDPLDAIYMERGCIVFTQRNEQYKERVEPFYDKLKSLILSEEDDAALELLTDISLGRVPLKKVK